MLEQTVFGSNKDLPPSPSTSVDDPTSNITNVEGTSEETGTTTLPSAADENTCTTEVHTSLVQPISEEDPLQGRAGFSSSPLSNVVEPASCEEIPQGQTSTVQDLEEEPAELPTKMEGEATSSPQCLYEVGPDDTMPPDDGVGMEEEIPTLSKGPAVSKEPSEAIMESTALPFEPSPDTAIGEMPQLYDHHGDQASTDPTESNNASLWGIIQSLAGRIRRALTIPMQLLESLWSWQW